MLGRKSFDNKPIFISLEDYVPKDNFLRRLEKAVDLSFIPDLVKGLYSRIGRPSIDPIVFFKISLIGFLYGITSDRQLMKDIHLNLGFRLFVGYNLDEDLPDHSTLSKTRNRFGLEVFQEIFDQIVYQCINAGLVGGEHLSFDATLVAADASMSSMTPRMSVAEFTKEVFENNPVNDESNDIDNNKNSSVPQQHNPTVKLAEPDESSKKNKKKTNPLSNATHVSKTDPDATLSKDRNSMMTKLSYKDNVSVDSKHRIITDCVAITGSEDEAIGVLDRLLRIKYKFGISPKEVSADKKYGTEKNLKGFEDSDVEAFIPIRKHGENTATGLYTLADFTYDEINDVMICPAGQKLSPASFLFEGRYRLFRAKKKICLSCPQKDQCTKIGEKRPTGRTLCVSIHRDCIERTKQRLKTAKGRKANNIRKTRVETIFGEGKNLHCLRRAKWRGLTKVHIQFLMIGMTQNIKRMVQILMPKHKAVNSAALHPFFSWIFIPFKVLQIKFSLSFVE